MTETRMKLCRFCLVEHPPCNSDYCYCAGKLGGWNRKGEGFNPECDYFFTERGLIQE